MLKYAPMFRALDIKVRIHEQADSRYWLDNRDRKQNYFPNKNCESVTAFRYP